jgi:hypothetical protein
MSHLVHVIEFKNYLTGLGVTCPFKQKEIINEAYTRALLRHSFRNGNSWSEDTEKLSWVMLEKWNSVSPIGAVLVHEQAIWRINNLRNTLAATGGLPCGKEYTVEVEGVDVTQHESFTVLVNFLVKELEACHE